MKALKFLLLTAFISISFQVNAAENSNAYESFVKGNTSYNQQKYDDALKNYKDAENSGIKNSNLFYNMGNTHFKLNNLGMAKVYYLKAQKYDHTNNDIKQNLSLINEKIVEKSEPSIREKILSKAFFWNSFLNIKEMTIFFLIIWSVFWIMVILKKRKNPALRNALNIYAIFALIFALSYFDYLYKFTAKEAVVTVQEAEVKTGIDSSSITVFKIHEGAEVKIIQSLDDWSKIELDADKKGWIKNSSINII